MTEDMDSQPLRLKLENVGWEIRVPAGELVFRQDANPGFF
jgi:hypothetical protein